MKKAICLLTLVFFLCSSVAFANKKWEIDVFSGSYLPYFSRKGHGFFMLDSYDIYGCTFSYQVSPKSTVRVQTDFFDTKVLVFFPKLSVKIKMLSISVLGTFNLINTQNYKIYSGIGLTSRQVKALWRKGPNTEPPYDVDIYDFSFPSGIVALLGFTNLSSHPYRVRAELQYTTGNKGQLFSVPLDWSGFKLLIGVGIKF